ncbi:hypothetical protein [Marispirochaeta aestuarii]|uniref:hypothetical protein n=1 Tax=Marispirochaeta aestuarii TaxID=1963862 RepID=UPI0029C8B197|nr:hypothetical protein [Marispirochaeta aestuarii]
MKQRKKRIDVLAISSGGGHWVQLLRLRSAWEDFDVVYATVNQASVMDVPGEGFHVIPDANRWKKTALIKSFYSVLFLVLRLRPKVIITTGAAPGFFALCCGKLTGARTMWLDSIANASQLSLSGRIVKYVADEWLTQWEDLAASNGPYFHGAVV